MVTCTRQAPACIQLLLMAPNNSTATTKTTTAVTTTSSTTTTTTSIAKALTNASVTVSDVTTVKPRLAYTIDALVGAETQSRLHSSTSSTVDSDCDVVGGTSPPAASPAPAFTACSANGNQGQLRRPLPLPATNIPQASIATNILPHMITAPALNFAPAHFAPRLQVAAGPPTSHPAMLSAQFHQMAAALAHQQQQQQQQQQQHLAGIHFPPGHPMALFPNQPHMLAAPSFVRDSYPLYPWFMTRHGRIFPHRFPGSKF